MAIRFCSIAGTATAVVSVSGSCADMCDTGVRYRSAAAVLANMRVEILKQFALSASSFPHFNPEPIQLDEVARDQGFNLPMVQRVDSVHGPDDCRQEGVFLLA